MQKEIKSFLFSIGLSEKEVILYLILLEHGPQTASTVSKRTGIARSTVGFVYDELTGKGFVFKNIQKKYAYYVAIHPDNIEYILQSRNAKIKKQMAELKEVLPFFNRIQETKIPLPKLQYFEGVEALCRLIDDCCQKDEVVSFLSAHNNMHPKIREYIYNVYIPLCKKKKNKNRMILNEGGKARDYAKRAEGVYAEIIFIDPKQYPFDLTIAIYGDKVAFCSYDASDLSGAILQNALIANQMLRIFEIIREHFSMKNKN